MNLENLIGKKEKVKIICKTNNNKYYVGKNVNVENTIYIEDTKDYEPEELIGKIVDCIIINIKQGNLIGFILDDRKFINDIKKINKKLKDAKQDKKIKDIYLMERLKIKGKVLGLYLVDEEEKRNILFRYFRNRNI